MLAKYFVLLLSLGLMNIYAKDNKSKKIETPKFEVKLKRFQHTIRDSLQPHKYAGEIVRRTFLNEKN